PDGAAVVSLLPHPVKIPPQRERDNTAASVAINFFFVIIHSLLFFLLNFVSAFDVEYGSKIRKTGSEEKLFYFFISCFLYYNVDSPSLSLYLQSFYIHLTLI